VTTAEVEPFHLLIYSDARERGGAEVTLAQMLAGLPPQVSVTIMAACVEVAEYLCAHRPGAGAHLVEPILDRRQIGRMLAHRRLFKLFDPDVIQFNLGMMSLCQWAIAVAITVPGPRLIAVENSSMGVWSATSRRLKSLTSGRLAAHLAVGERTSRMVEQLSGLPAGSVETMYHGVAEPDRTGARHESTIVSVARHDPVKGIDVLLDAMPAIDQSIGLHQIGGGPLLDQHQAQAERLGLSDRVTFLQPDWDTRVADLLSGYELFVLPSRTEGLPVSIMEAMLAGLPIVVTDVGSVREEVTHGVHGLVVPPEDPAALAAAINELMADPARRAVMGAAARERAEEMFTVATTVERYCGVYRRVLGSKSRRRTPTVWVR